jgi:hypothetical protein
MNVVSKLAAVLCAFLALGADAQTVSHDPWDAADAWLCAPGRSDLCAGPFVRTTIGPDGTTTREELRADPAAAIDCFYVYPTISEDPNGNSRLTPGPGERRAVEQQFAMFASVCRPFAPMYRQLTLAGLRSVLVGKPIAIDPELNYRDVVAAWKHYLAHDNRGRGVVLIGHSQGSRMLVQLLQREIEGTPAQALLVSAVLPGFNVEVPRGADRGGTFPSVPLCASSAQSGCVIAYVSFRSSAPPPENARFGRTRTPGMEIACVDPVALSGRPVSSFLPVRTNLLGRTPQRAEWLAMAGAVDAAFVNLPGLLQARCVRDGSAAWLSIALESGPPGKRPQDIPGDVVFEGRILDDWGLHLVDVNLVAGNLVEVVRQQAAAYMASRGGGSR